MLFTVNEQTKESEVKEMSDPSPFGVAAKKQLEAEMCGSNSNRGYYD